MSGDLKQEQSPRWQRFKDWGEFVFALVLTGYGVAGYYVVSGQLEVMWLQTAITQNQLIDAERSSRRARQDIDTSLANQKTVADSTTTMAQEFTKQTTQSREALHLDQRAWVGFSSARIAELKLGEPVQVKVQIINSGKTPAKNLQLWIHLDVAIAKEPFPSLKHGEVFEGSNVLLYPNVTVGIFGTFHDANGDPKPVDQALTQGIKAGVGFIIAHGRVTYQDVFNQPHWATFCFMTRNDTPWGTLTECERGNESDS